MKKLLIKIFAVASIVVYAISCSKETVHYKLSGIDADFVVTNKTTGESLENKGIIINVGGGEGEVLKVASGDELELVYRPDSEYAKYSWSVDFKLFNDEIVAVSKSPYKYSFTVGDVQEGIYYISCKAVIDDSDVEAEGFITGSVRVKVVE